MQPAFDDHCPVFNDTFNFDHKSMSDDFRTCLWRDALDRLDKQVPTALLDKAWHSFRSVDLNLTLRAPRGGLDLAALRPKQSLPIDVIQIGLRSRSVPSLFREVDHVAWAASLTHPANSLPVIESDLRFAAEGLTRCSELDGLSLL